MASILDRFYFGMSFKQIKAINPFASKDWLNNGERLTHNRMNQIEKLFNGQNTVNSERIKDFGSNFGRYAAFRAIVHGIAKDDGKKGLIRIAKIDYQSFFTEWKNWDDFEPRIDGINGVYSFRLKEEFGRLKGKSNILYFGQVEQNPAKNKRPGIWHRLMNYRQNNKGASARLKEIEDQFGGRHSIEYAYEVCDNPRDTEKELLEGYYNLHLEYPPLNRSA